MNRPEPGELYRLYSGSVCRVVCIANQAESNVTLVVVHPVPEDGFHLAIPAEVFAGRVMHNGFSVPRYTKVKQR